VTRDASGVRDVVVVVDVAIGTGPWRNRMQAGEGKAALGVIVLRRRPATGRVTDFASLWEILGDVIRVLGSLVVLQVTRDASRVRDVVVVVDVAVGALPGRNGVQPGQREATLGVVELRGRPATGRVARFASLRKALLHVIRIVRVLVIIQVTRNASGHRDVVVVVDVAISTGPRRNRVHSGEREAKLCVVKIRRRPSARGVASFAGSRNLCAEVIHRRFRVVVIVLVTADARRVGDVVVVVDVTVGTLPRWHRVQAGQREATLGVIERGGLPGAGRVA